MIHSIPPEHHKWLWLRCTTNIGPCNEIFISFELKDQLVNVVKEQRRDFLLLFLVPSHACMSVKQMLTKIIAGQGGYQVSITWTEEMRNLISSNKPFNLTTIFSLTMDILIVLALCLPISNVFLTICISSQVKIIIFCVQFNWHWEIDYTIALQWIKSTQNCCLLLNYLLLVV